MALSGYLPQINLGVQGVTQGGHHSGAQRVNPEFRVGSNFRIIPEQYFSRVESRRVGQRSTLNLSRAVMSSRWCGVVVRRGGCQLRCRPRHLTMVQNYVVRRQKPSCS
ncbi:uncharacterized protein TNCV_4975811 [Trichonephila clavipes]|uniref:Uncharacterized protein n=1 Tax=Trichonephila clavipes TaxID=2585209 RepID=A0A8X6SPH8_TRICX|nr:uncharacterized protein TNCV_4975811 [Trichonephila clavipes]